MAVQRTLAAEPNIVCFPTQAVVTIQPEWLQERQLEKTMLVLSGKQGILFYASGESTPVIVC